VIYHLEELHFHKIVIIGLLKNKKLEGQNKVSCGITLLPLTKLIIVKFLYQLLKILMEYAIIQWKMAQLLQI